jgi:Ca2+-binding RTX toxin-like protein
VIVSTTRSTDATLRHLVLLFAAALLLWMAGDAHAIPPQNDDFADAQPVTEPLPFTLTQLTTEATDEPDEPLTRDFGCGFSSATVWYSYAPSADTVVAADTIGSDFDTVLAVWQGNDLASLTLVGCADDSRGGRQSSVPFLAEAGTEYHIQIGGFVGDTGSLSFRVRQTTAGFVEGTVTDDGTGAPLQGVCVAVADAVFNGSNLTGTSADGTYRVAVRPGEYIVAFFDCERDAIDVEFWDDVGTESEATEIVVVANLATSGIDAAVRPACPGFGGSDLASLVGTSGPDILTGTAVREVVCGSRGDDVLRGGGGGDVVLGGGGADRVIGGDGGDFLEGGRGPDSLFGGNGRDELNGGRGRPDRCIGGPGRDSVQGGCEVQRSI